MASLKSGAFPQFDGERAFVGRTGKPDARPLGLVDLESRLVTAEDQSAAIRWAILANGASIRRERRSLTSGQRARLRGGLRICYGWGAGAAPAPLWTEGLQSPAR